MGVESSLYPKRLLSVPHTSPFPKAKIQNISDAVPDLQERDAGRLAGLTHLSRRKSHTSYLCLDPRKQRRVRDPYLAGCGHGGHGICRKELVD